MNTPQPIAMDGRYDALGCIRASHMMASCATSSATISHWSRLEEPAPMYSQQDEQPETITMSKRGKARVVTLGALSPKIAQDKALPSLVESVTKANRNDVKTKLIAMDGDLEAEKLEAVLEALMDDEPAADARSRR